MLIITRKLNEALWLELGQVKIKILSVKGTTVRLGIDADSSISVDREEIALIKLREQKVSSNKNHLIKGG
jgi:carbon storage regulator CsrA